MFLIYVWMKEYMKICVILFKMLKSVFELTYQTPPKCLDSIDVVKRLPLALIDITKWLSWALMNIAMVFLGIGLIFYVQLE